MSRPLLIGLPSDCKPIGKHLYQTVGEKYVRAIVDAVGAVPMMIPSLSPPLPLEGILRELDGLFLTGSYINIEPHHYSDEPSYPGNLHDPARDATSLPIIPLAIKLGLPVLAVCRGMQEVNVALGGSLHQKVHEVPGLNDHREDMEAALDVQYGPIHEITLCEGGILSRVAGSNKAMVNSLHGQGINKLAPSLVPEALAPDGLIEAARLDSPDNFLLAVQWHPEWKVTQNPFYLGIFKAFKAACEKRAAQRA